MKKFLLLLIPMIMTLCSCDVFNSNEPKPTAYLEEPILDDIPSITIDETIFSYLGVTYEDLCTIFEDEGVLYEYADFYEYYFNNYIFRFHYSTEDEPEEPTVYEFVATISDFIRMDNSIKTKSDIDLILGEGETSSNYTYIRYIYNSVYLIDISCDGEYIYPQSPIVIKRVSVDD